MSSAVGSQADILVSLSRLQLVQSSKDCVRMELLLLIFSMLMVDFVVAARDKSAGSLPLLVSDVLTHWVRTCSMSSIGRVDCDDEDDTRVYCHRRTSPLSLGSTPSFRFGLKIAILGGFRGILGPCMGQGRIWGGCRGAVAPPWKLAEIYFLVHQIFVPWKLWIWQYF